MADEKQKLIDGLNEDLAHEWQAVIMYATFASLTTGHTRPEMRDFFLAEIQEELGHAQFLSDKIAALGGTPTTEPAALQLARDNREMLQIAHQAEVETIERYRKRIDQADDVGDLGLRVRLEDLVSDETQHKEDIEQILANWRG